jgi:hypothetical protein
MKVCRLCEFDACDVCRDTDVNPRNKCFSCGAVLCHTHSVLIPMRDDNGDTYNSKLVCPTCKKEMFCDLLVLEGEITELQAKLKNLKMESHRRMAELINNINTR